DLDLMVARRTTELQTTNDNLTREIAERTKVEQAFRVVFEASPIGIGLLNQDLKFVNANRALQSLHGISRNDILGHDPIDVGWFHSGSELNELFAAHLAR